MPMPQNSPHNKPVHSVRLGQIQGAIWKQTGKNNSVFFSVTICRSYKDGNEYKNTDFFGAGDLATVAKVADVCLDWILREEEGQ